MTKNILIYTIYSVIFHLVFLSSICYGIEHLFHKSLPFWEILRFSLFVHLFRKLMSSKVVKSYLVKVKDAFIAIFAIIKSKFKK